MKPKNIEFNGYVYLLGPDGYYRRRKWSGGPTGKKRPDMVRGDGGQTNLHRAVWTFHNGPIPKGFNIHHIDRDPSNNDLANLQLIDCREHTRLHALEMHRNGTLKPDGAALKRWMATDEGKRVKREQGFRSWQGREWVEKACEICGVAYRTVFPTRSRICGGNACQLHRIRQRRKGLA